MTALHFFAIEISVFALLYMALTVYVIKTRRRLQVAVGEGSDSVLLRAIRAQGNFAEQVPIFLLLQLTLVLLHAPLWRLVVLFVVMLVGRLSHAYGLLVAEQRPQPIFTFRVAGMACTFASLGLSVLSLLILAFG